MQTHFDPELSHKLDTVQILLDLTIPRWVRWTLQLYKRILELGIK